MNALYTSLRLALESRERWKQRAIVAGWKPAELAQPVDGAVDNALTVQQNPEASHG